MQPPVGVSRTGRHLLVLGTMPTFSRVWPSDPGNQNLIRALPFKSQAFFMFLTAFKPQCKGGVVFWGCRDRHSSTNRAASAGDVCCLRVLEDKSPTPRAERGWPPGAVRGSPARVSRRSRGLPTIWGRPWLVRASPRSLSLYVVFSLDTFMSKSPCL